MIRLLSGDCRDVLPTLPAESVQCMVTSPPYYGLRDYQTASWTGGSADCAHVGEVSRTVPPGTAKQASNFGANGVTSGDCCRCGAVRVDRQIGLEATPDEYLATMVGVFREVRRVLRRDGTCWVNIGDSYSSGSRTTQCDPSAAILGKVTARPTAEDGGARRAPSGVAKPKDLLLMPARLALALQADGWWVRSDVIWHKPNPMPESCRDRPTSAHEHVFLLTKSGTPTGWTHRDGLPGMTTLPPPDYRWVHKKTGEQLNTDPGDPQHWRRINLWRGHDYFYDADAVREPLQESTLERGYTATHLVNGGSDRERDNADRMVRQGKGWWDNAYVPSSRNLRNVWTIATHAYPEAHFATFPPELAERCIKAGTSERGCCVACGKPWARVVEKGAIIPQDGWAASASARDGASDGRNQASNRLRDGHVPGTRDVTTAGWSAGCKCNADVVPCTILDPFAGAGTSLLCADRLQRDAIGIELNVAYTEMAMERCRADAPLFTSFSPAEDPEDARMADLFTDMAAD